MHFTCSVLNIIYNNIRFNQAPLERYIGRAKTCIKSGTPGSGLGGTGFPQSWLEREM